MELNELKNRLNILINKVEWAKRNPGTISLSLSQGEVIEETMKILSDLINLLMKGVTVKIE